MFTIDADMKPIEQFENDLDRFGKKALPYAARDTLSTAAWETQKKGRQFANHLFTMRNKYTERSIIYTKAFGLNIDNMESAAGSTLDYMRFQEEGFKTSKKGKHGIAIPTAAAAGQSGARTRTRPVRKANQLSRLNIARGMSSEYRKKYTGSRQRLIRMAQDAIEYGHRTIFWKSKRSSRMGFYKVIGGKRTGRGWPDGMRLEMIYGTPSPITITKDGDWLSPSVKMIERQMEKIYWRAVVRQIRINRSFRDRG